MRISSATPGRLRVFGLSIVGAYRPVIEDYYPKATSITTVGVAFEAWVSASDPEYRPLTYRWFLGNRLLYSGSASYAYIPEEADVGSQQLRVVVSNGYLSASHTWNITVVPQNRAPVLTSWSPNGSVLMVAGDVEAFRVDGYDPEGHQLVYSWYINETESGGHDQAYIFDSREHGPGTYTLKVELCDAEHCTPHTWQVVVVGKNAPAAHPPDYYTAAVPFVVVGLVIAFVEAYRRMVRQR